MVDIQIGLGCIPTREASTPIISSAIQTRRDSTPTAVLFRNIPTQPEDILPRVFDAQEEAAIEQQERCNHLAGWLADMDGRGAWQWKM
mmetsp:Transcript_39286/g.63737  ORF Transcript_39286/g.63737 Transcript_39286/m.63737 type:complete len:88 (+) Transcript_39286:720-983(+)